MGFLEDQKKPDETGRTRPLRVLDLNEVPPPMAPPYPAAGKNANGADDRKPESVMATDTVGVPTTDNVQPPTKGGSGGMANMGLGF